MGNVEIMSRVERRRKWTAAEKMALLAEVEAAGGRVSLVARRHRIAESLLYNWRAARKAAAAVLQMPQSAAFIPLGVIAESASVEPTIATVGQLQHGQQIPMNNSLAGGIEIALPNGVRVCVDALVNDAALVRVLRVMKNMT